MLSSTLLPLLILALASRAQADETTIDTVAVDGETSVEETVEIIENDEPSSNSDEDKGLDNTEVNCHKCLRASFNFRKVDILHEINVSNLQQSMFRSIFVRNAKLRACSRRRMPTPKTATSAESRSSMPSTRSTARRSAT